MPTTSSTTSSTSTTTSSTSTTSTTLPGSCATPVTIPAGGGIIPGKTTGAASANAGSCDASVSPENVFQWTPNVSGTALVKTCDPAVTNFDTVLYVREAVCLSGTERACNNDTPGCDTTTMAGKGSNVSFSVTAGTTYFIFVDGVAGASGNFTLTVIPPTGTCAAPILLPAAGGMFAGSTTGASNQTGTCQATTSASPENIYQWTPSTTGIANIQTCSGTLTDFDTVLYLRTTTCGGGAEADCNDDTPGCATTTTTGKASHITPLVTAGTTYFVIVDGAGGASGNYKLTVTPP